jgi:stalled ribosome rescue protein Dom34
VRLAVEQSARVLVFGYDDDNRAELESHGDIAAVLRF